MENNIYKKLLKVKASWIKLQRDVKAYNYKYADLGQIQEKLWEALQEQKLLVMHKVIWNAVQTIIRDTESEDFIESTIPMSEWTKPQDKWSEITYYRRYNLLSLLDLEVEDSDAVFSREDSKSKNEPTERFWEDNFTKFKEVKDNYTKQNAVKECRSKYKVSKEWAWKIEALYN